MKAQFVFENVKFERVRDPKRAVGIGSFGQKKFDSLEEAVDFLYYYLTPITGYHDESIFGPPENTLLFADDAVKSLSRFSSDFDIKSSSNALTFANLLRVLWKKIKEEGFPKVNENVKFERSKDPKSSMGLGRWKEGEEIVVPIYDFEKNGGILKKDREIWSSSRHTGYALKGYYLGYDPKQKVHLMYNNNYKSMPIPPGFGVKVKTKVLYEKINFKRGQDPKDSMGIGGYTMEEVYNDIVGKAEKEYGNFLKKSFVGKTVTGKMMKWNEQGHNWKDWTINVARINHRFRGPEFYFIDDNGDTFTPLTDEPIKVVKKTNESQNFTRTGNPKAGLDIGGIILGKVRKDFRDEAKIRWEDWIRQNIVGHTITAKMKRIQRRTEDGYEVTGGDWDNFTVRVKDVGEINAMDHPAIFIEDEDGWMYALPVDDKKIWIKA